MLENVDDISCGVCIAGCIFLSRSNHLIRKCLKSSGALVAFVFRLRSSCAQHVTKDSNITHEDNHKAVCLHVPVSCTLGPKAFVYE